jgi:hypothetical protein
MSHIAPDTRKKKGSYRGLRPKLVEIPAQLSATSFIQILINTTQPGRKEQMLPECPLGLDKLFCIVIMATENQCTKFRI